MYKTLGNNIILTRGDTLQLKVSLYNQDGTEYEPASGDVIRFAMKKNYTDAEPLLNITIPNDTLMLTLQPADTNQLDFGPYVYDLEITKADGTVDTFIAEASFVLAPEVH